MKKLILAISFLFCAGGLFADFKEAVKEWSAYETELRKGQLTSSEAAFKAERLVPKLFEETQSLGIAENPEWTFPVKGFAKQNVGNAKKIISETAANFREPKFFDGQEFLAQKFIRLNVVSKERESDLPAAEVVAANNAVVVYVKKNAVQSIGGNAVWLYNPAQNFFIYYGKLRDVHVNLGDALSAGDKIGTIKPLKKGYDFNFAVLSFADGGFTIFDYLSEM